MCDYNDNDDDGDRGKKIQTIHRRSRAACCLLLAVCCVFEQRVGALLKACMHTSYVCVFCRAEIIKHIAALTIIPYF